MFLAMLNKYFHGFRICTKQIFLMINGKNELKVNMFTFHLQLWDKQHHVPLSKKKINNDNDNDDDDDDDDENL